MKITGIRSDKNFYAFYNEENDVLEINGNNFPADDQHCLLLVGAHDEYEFRIMWSIPKDVDINDVEIMDVDGMLSAEFPEADSISGFEVLMRIPIGSAMATIH